jgi:hypothetical protein
VPLRRQPSTKTCQDARATSQRMRAPSGHSSVSNTAGAKGMPWLTCHQIMTGHLARGSNDTPRKHQARIRPQRFAVGVITSPNPLPPHASRLGLGFSRTREAQTDKELDLKTLRHSRTIAKRKRPTTANCPPKDRITAEPVVETLDKKHATGYGQADDAHKLAKYQIFWRHAG